jgi:hypothetical protein
MSAHPDPTQNQLLAARPKVDWQRWLSQLEPVSLQLGQMLYEPGDTMSHVYFPTTAIASLLYLMESGASARRRQRRAGRHFALHGG